MNSSHICDWKDAYKRAVFSSLPKELRADLHVVPMRSDVADWEPEGTARYLRCIGLEGAAIHWEGSYAGSESGFRSSLDSLASHDCDIFIDPDIGIGRRDYQHVTPDEIQALLKANRVLAVYQDLNHKEREWIDGFLSRFADTAAFYCVGVRCALVFLARYPTRLARYREALRQFGPRASAADVVPVRFSISPVRCAACGLEGLYWWHDPASATDRIWTLRDKVGDEVHVCQSEPRTARSRDADTDA